MFEQYHGRQLASIELTVTAMCIAMNFLRVFTDISSGKPLCRTILFLGLSFCHSFKIAWSTQSIVLCSFVAHEC